MTRPIDADTLHALFDEKCACECDVCTFHEKCKERFYCGLIDLAPTIPLPGFKEGYKQAIRDGKTNFSRPQGKWIKTVMFGEKCLECDQCGKADFNIRHYKFCPDCGAEMEVKNG